MNRKNSRSKPAVQDFSANTVARGELMLAVAAAIREKGWTQGEAADFLGVGQPRISDVVQGRIDRFSVDTLMTWLQKLGKDVGVTVRDNVFSSADPVELVLYVCGAPDQSLLDNVARLFGGEMDRFSLRVVDVFRNPEQAAKEQISSTPCLVKESPLPRVVLAGDMSSASIRWQLAVAERVAMDKRDGVQERRQEAQDQRESLLGEREREQSDREKISRKK